MKKLLVGGIMLLLVFVSIPSTGRVMEQTSTVSSDGNIIYVDDDNTEGPWDGTTEHPYQYIQDGIDNASKGDTVFVYNGTYYENAVVNKSINLIGENRDSTIVDGINNNEYVINVENANNVNISYFTVRNNTYLGLYGAGVLIKNSNNTSIYKNTFINLWEGAVICHTKCINISIIKNNITMNKRHAIESSRTGRAINWTIKENTIVNNSYYGIKICYAHGCHIVSNTIVDNRLGINLLSSGKDNVITRNFISGNEEQGIDINNHHSNIISYNTISNNSLGLYLRDVTENIIEYNNFINNKRDNFYENDNQFPVVFRSNRWVGNYYSQWIGLIPKPIFVLSWIYIPDFWHLGYEIPIPLFPMFDWRPALKPYDI